MRLVLRLYLIVSESTHKAQRQEENQAAEGGAEDKGDYQTDHRLAPLGISFVGTRFIIPTFCRLSTTIYR